MGRKKLTEMNQIHGKIDPEEEGKFEPSTLAQMWGDTGESKYKTLNNEEYQLQLSDMNTADLRSHAVKLGIMPIQSRERLSKKLMVEFARHVSSYKKPILDKNRNKKVSKEVWDIMSEAR